MPSLSKVNSPLSSAPGAGILLSARGYSFLQSYIHRETGIVLDEDKWYLIEGRLQPVVRSENLQSLDELCDRLAAGRSPLLAALVIDAMTTNETLFFRDALVFEALKNLIFPKLMAAIAGSRKLRIWSAASSSGQEAYSIAMLLLEAGYDADRVEILGTDLSRHMLERARRGRYVSFEIKRGLPPALLTKYFTKVDSAWQVKEQVRAMVRFEEADLRGKGPTGQYDLVLCRNVLIYFDAETKQRILSSLAQAMVPEGLLVLGCAETLLKLNHSFKRRVIGQSTFYTL